MAHSSSAADHRRNPVAHRGAVLAVILAAAAAAIAGCSERDDVAPLGLGTVSPDRSGEIVRTVFAPAPRLDTASETLVGAGSSGAIYAGFVGDRPMRGLVRFAPLPSGRAVRAATIHLAVTGGDSLPATIALHRVRADWGETSADATNLPAFDVAPIASAVSARGDTTLAIALPESLAQRWTDSPETNFGLLLEGLDAAVLRRFGSREASSGRPLLVLSSDPGDGSTVLDSIAADRDTYVASPDTASGGATATRLRIGPKDGFSCRAAFEFDLPVEVDSSATVNFAALELSVDPSIARAAETSVEVSVHEVVSAVDTSAVVFRAEAEATRAIAAGADTLSLPITGLVARQRLAGETRVKLVVKTRIETVGTDSLAVVSAEGAAAAADSLARPRLRLIVSAPRPEATP
jgi:hypothetical protein